MSLYHPVSVDRSLRYEKVRAIPGRTGARFYKRSGQQPHEPSLGSSEFPFREPTQIILVKVCRDGVVHVHQYLYNRCLNADKLSTPPPSSSLGLADFSQVDMMCVWYKSVN